MANESEIDLSQYGLAAERVGEVLFTSEVIAARVAELGQQISADYAPIVGRGEAVLLIGLLKGVVIFMADLLRQLTIPVEVDFMDISHYSLKDQAGGVLNLSQHIRYPIENYHVLFVEDIVDRGLTLNHLMRNLRARQPASLRVCTMFDKRARRVIDVPLDYVGFELPDVFVVGYGLDDEQKYRNLPFVGLLKEVEGA